MREKVAEGRMRGATVLAIVTLPLTLALSLRERGLYMSLLRLIRTIQKSPEIFM